MIRSRRLLALTLLAGATLAAPVAPAGAAAGSPVQAKVYLRNLTLPATGPAVDEHVAVILTADRAGWAKEVTLSVDTSAATAVAGVAVKATYPGGTCSTTGSVVRCTLPGPHRIVGVPDSGSFGVVTTASVLIRLTPRPGVAPGDTGALTVAARADGGPITTETSRVRIGEGVNLTAVDATPRPVAPGGTAALRPRVRNTGSRDVRGLVLVITGGALTGTDFGNCTYDDVVTCAFDTTVAAGRAYRISAPFAVRIPRDAAAGSETGLGLQWLTRAEWEDWRESWDVAPGVRRGTGPDLALEALAPAAAARVPQADTDGDDNGTFSPVTVSGGRRADVVAVGAAVTGPAGEARTIEVGLVNRGPGALRYPPFSNNMAAVDVTLPPGLTVVRADERCTGVFDEDPAGPPPSTAAGASFGSSPAYSCYPSSVHLRPGQRLTFTFTVRARPGARAGNGSVEVRMYDDAVDRNAGNNTAPITVDVRGGGLPVTGSATAAVSGGGVLIMLLGAAVMMVLRRRSGPTPAGR